MQKPKIYILSGPVHSGKTTRLKNWLENKKEVKGILSPVINKVRYILDISSGKEKCLQVDKNTLLSNEVTQIGNYTFSNEVFKWAQEILFNAIQARADWLIIDEIGWLELDGIGLEPTVSAILNNLEKYQIGNIVLVVREKLIEKVVHFYGIKNNWLSFDFPER